MKTGRSDQPPEVIVQSNGLTQVRYHIMPFTEERNGQTVSGYSYDYVEIGGKLTRAKLISVIIRESYSADAELALIHNEIQSPGTEEYVDYQTFRESVKAIVAEIVS